jgi:hypothetical protein
MSTDRDVTRIVRSWLEEGVTALPDRVLDTVLDQVPATSQRRPWWPARRVQRMNTAPKLAFAAAAVVAVAVAGINFLPGKGGTGGPGVALPSPTASPSPTPSPIAFRDGPLVAGRYVMTPFSRMANASTVCYEQPGCSENPADDTIRVTLTVPDGYEGAGNRPLIWGNPGATTAETGLIILRGGGLYSDPCHTTPPPDIAVGPTVDDFANALANHPALDATTPVAVTLAGYSGKYLDLQLPADVSQCTDDQFWPFEPGVYAQGPSHRWHLWILDVEGVRVVIQSMDYASTTPQHRDELQAIVDSITIDP